MRSLGYIAFVIVLVVTIAGCFPMVTSNKEVSGRPIDESLVSKIVKGKTTSSQIVELFGAPTEISKTGNDELYIYRYCKKGGASVDLVIVGTDSSKEKCNELTVIVDKTTGKVKEYSYQKQLKK